MAEEIGSLFVSISADLSGFDQALLNTRSTLEALAAQGGLLGSLPAQTEQQAGQIITGLQRAFHPLPDALRSGLEAPLQRALDSVKAIVEERLNNIIGMVNNALSQINGMLAQIPGSSGGGGNLAIEPRADGGSVTGGQPYLVGEAGPELFVPGRSGTIIPNHALNSGGGVSIRGGTFHIYGVQDAAALYDQLREIAHQRA